MRKMKLDEMQACLWHLRNARLMMTETEFNPIAEGLHDAELVLNESFWEGLQKAKEIQQAMDEHNERSEK